MSQSVNLEDRLQKIREKKEQAIEAFRLSELEVSLAGWQQRLREMESKLRNVENEQLGRILESVSPQKNPQPSYNSPSTVFSPAYNQRPPSPFVESLRSRQTDNAEPERRALFQEKDEGLPRSVQHSSSMQDPQHTPVFSVPVPTVDHLQAGSFPQTSHDAQPAETIAPNDNDSDGSFDVSADFTLTSQSVIPQVFEEDNFDVTALVENDETPVQFLEHLQKLQHMQALLHQQNHVNGQQMEEEGALLMMIKQEQQALHPQSNGVAYLNGGQQNGSGEQNTTGSQSSNFEVAPQQASEKFVDSPSMMPSTNPDAENIPSLATQHQSIPPSDPVTAATPTRSTQLLPEDLDTPLPSTRLPSLGSARRTSPPRQPHTIESDMRSSMEWAAINQQAYSNAADRSASSAATLHNRSVLTETSRSVFSSVPNTPVSTRLHAMETESSIRRRRDKTPHKYQSSTPLTTRILSPHRLPPPPSPASHVVAVTDEELQALAELRRQASPNARERRYTSPAASARRYQSPAKVPASAPRSASRTRRASVPPEESKSPSPLRSTNSAGAVLDKARSESTRRRPESAQRTRSPAQIHARRGSSTQPPPFRFTKTIPLEQSAQQTEEPTPRYRAGYERIPFSQFHHLVGPNSNRATVEWETSLRR